MNIFFDLKQKLIAIISDLAKKSDVIVSEIQFATFTVEPCKDKNHGDLATNAAMVFCKNFGLKPQELAAKIIEHLKNDPWIKDISIAGAGFINMVLQDKVWEDFLKDVLKNEEFKLPLLSDGKELINVEYASPNPTGPMHIGHARGAVYGDVLATLLQKTGHKITREYYINDAGSQIITLVKSAHLRYLEALGQTIEIPEGLYPGEYLKPVGEALKQQFGDSLKNLSHEEYISQIRDFVVSEMLKMIVSDLAELGVHHDTLFSEKKNLHDTGKIEEAIKILENKGLIYAGKIEAPKDSEIAGEDFSIEEQTLFRSSDFGDDSDRVVKKSDGTPTYLAGDIAYLKSKFERGATKMIMPLGYDHAGYVKRLSAACTAITDGKASVKVILCQMVKFVKNGQQLKMSKRAGNFITLKDVLDEVGADALRFTMLTRKNDAPFDFDLAKVIEQSKDNPIFYIQYANARCASVLRHLKEQMPDLFPYLGEKSGFSSDSEKRDNGVHIINVKNINSDLLKNLSDEAERELIKKLANFPRTVEMAVVSYEPHRIAFYLQELAGLFHSLWNKGSDNPELKFIIPNNKELTLARVNLLIATMRVIAAGLSIFNIKPLNEM